MGVNVLGGSLEFDAILTTGGLDAAIASLEASLLQVIAKFEKVGDAGTASLDDLKKKFAELVEQEKALSEASANATDPAKVKEYNDKIAETIGKMKELAIQLQKVEDSNPALGPAAQPVASPSVVSASSGATLEELRAKMVQLEKEEIKLQMAIERTLDPDLVKQYNVAIDATIARMTALGKQIQQVQASSAAAGTPVNPNVSSTPTTPATPATPTEDPVEPIKKQIQAYQQLQNLRNKLASMDKSDPLFKATFDEAVKLQGKINEVNRSLQLFSRGTAGIQAMTSAVRGVVGGFEVWNGILGITADQNDEVQKAVTRAVSAMSVLNGITEVVALFDKQNAANLYLTNLLRKESAVSTEMQAIATEALTVAEGEQAVATEAATVAQVELNTAMEANPVGVLLLALTGIVVALQAFASSQKDVTEQQTKANEAAAEGADILNKLVDLQREVYDERARDAANAVNLAQAQGKSDQTILDLKLKALEAQKQANLFALAGLGYNKEDLGILKASVENVLEKQHAINAARDADGELTKEQQKQLDLLNAQLKNYEAQYGPLVRLVEGNKQLTAQIAENRAESDKKINDAGLRSFEAVADAQLQIAKKNTKEELDAKIEAIRRQEAVQLNNANLTAAEQVDIAAKANRQIDDLNKAYQQTLLKDAADAAQAKLAATKKGTQEELDAQIGVIRATAQQQLAEDGLLAGERARIRAQETADIEEVERKRSLLILDNQKENLRAQLDLVQQGSAEELRLKLQLLQNEAQAEIVSAQGNAAKILRINADLEKAQADLRRKYALENSQAEVETIIAGINTRLTAVQKGSEDELALKKNLVDREATLDILQAKERITNEQLLQAKILQISAEANLKKRKLDDDYVDALLSNNFKIIDSETKAKTASLSAVQNDPFASPLAKAKAQLAVINAEIEGNNRKIAETVGLLALGIGDIAKIAEKLAELQAKGAKLAADKIAESNAKNAALFKEISDGVANLGQVFNELSDALDETNPKVAAFLNSWGQILSFEGRAAQQFAAGDFAGGAASIISGVVKLLAQAAEKTRLAEKEVQDYYTALITGEVEYQELLRQRERQQLELNATTLQGIRDEQSALTKQKGAIQKEIDDLMQQIAKQTYTVDQSLANSNLFGGVLAYTPVGAIANLFGIGRSKTDQKQQVSLAGLSFDQIQELFMQGRLDDKAKALFQELENLKKEGVDIDATLVQLQEKTKEIFTGTTTDNIAQGIIDGFKQGYRSAADFASNFQELMTNAILSSLEAQTLQPALKDFYDQFANFSASDGVLTSDEVDQLKKIYNDIITNFSNQVDNLQAISGLNLSGANAASNSLSGAIKGITESQAELLAGQFGGLRLTAMDQLNMATRQFQVLQDIQRDTSNLPEVRAILRRLELNGVKITS